MIRCAQSTPRPPMRTPEPRTCPWSGRFASAREFNTTGTNQSFLRPFKICDIYFFERKTQSRLTAMIRPISTQNPFWISFWNPNSGGWTRSYGFALFICRKPHFSKPWFDIACKNPIGCMYPFRSWKWWPHELFPLKDASCIFPSWEVGSMLHGTDHPTVPIAKIWFCPRLAGEWTWYKPINAG